ncbi:MAG: polyprenyl synthetase family protein [Thermodesulfobacteriota bacterium]
MTSHLPENNFDLTAYLKNRRRQINDTLQRLLDCRSAPSRLCDAMSHALMDGGKRLRPVLCLAAAEAVGGKIRSVLPAACAIEMIHTYSLVHDDLPAMDDDAMRRGKPTCHVEFDEATAILAGDALLTRAFEVLATAEMDGVDAANRLRAISIASSAAGYRGMIEGQMQDLDAEGRTIDIAALKTLHGLKTGAMIEAAVTCGAVLADAPENQYRALKAYAAHIGLAFQVTDDILNVEGDPARMGKAAGTDAARDKSTYPALMGVDKSRQYAGQLTNKALQSLNEFDNKATPLAAIASYITHRKR